MLNLYIAPKNYITGYDIMENIGDYVKKMSKKVLILSDETVYSIIGKAVGSFEKNGIKYRKEYFGGECSHNEIERIKSLIEEENYDAVAGFGVIS